MSQIFGLIYLHNFKPNFQFHFLNFAFPLINIAITCFLSRLFLPISWFFPAKLAVTSRLRTHGFLCLLRRQWEYLPCAMFLDFELRFHRKIPCWLIQDFHFCLTSLLSYKFIFSLAKANKFSTLLLEATQGIPRHDGGSSMVKNKLFLLPKIWARFPLLDSLYYHFQF